MSRVWIERLVLVSLGVGLGYLAKYVIGPPASRNTDTPRQFSVPFEKLELAPNRTLNDRR